MAQKCVHQGCGKVYTDPEEKCVYHPGPPVFHEGQKGWKCCKPRVLTFDEFMSIPPCTTGLHSTTDLPPVIEKKPAPAEAPAPPPPAAPARLPVTTPQNAPSPPIPQPQSDSDDPAATVPAGTMCRRKGCGVQYTGGSREGETCVYHPGVAIFHEGSKGYSCCKRRVLEFDEFMKIVGCKTKGRHLFLGSGKDKAGKGGEGGEELVENVRSDYYQTATTVIASFFLKKIVKDESSVSFTKNTVDLDLKTSDAPPKRFKKVVELYGPIDVEKSSFKIMGTKLELTLAKLDGQAWPVLRADEKRTGEIFQVGRAGLV